MTGEESTSMALTPEEIAAKEFLVGLRGYDKEEVRVFLNAVSVDYRALIVATTPVEAEEDAATADGAVVTSVLPTSEAPTEATEGDRPAVVPGAGTGTTSPEDWARMGEEVAAVLRTAHEQVAALKAKAEEEAAEHKRKLE